MAGENGSSYAQGERLLAIDTELGQDQLLLTRLEGEDAISRGFSLSLELATHLPASDVRTLLGKPVTLWIGGDSAPAPRPIHGLVRQLTQLDQDAREFQLWKAEIVPQFWFLTCTADCRVFQTMSIPDIIRKVLDEHSIAHFEIRGLIGDYPKLEFCVQYRESSFNFLSRLMEHVGIFYWYEHFENKHVLVMSDSNNAMRSAFVETVSDSNRPDLGAVATIEHDYAFRPGKWAMTDYDFQSPTKQLGVNTPTMLDVPRMTDHEIYDYPGGFTNASMGSFLTRRRIEQEEARHHRVRGNASTSGFDAGRLVTVEPAQSAANGERYALTELRHHAWDPSHLTNPSAAPTYNNTFVAIPAKVPFRPERLTPKPFVRGPQTATVTGPAGEEIFTDEHGRVKVRFHWDRNPDGNKDEGSSCWLRVSQAWAGAGWGAIHIPRIGQEVIVDFLEGDPDRPIITGRVYNGDKKLPYPTPAQATQSGLKSNSSRGGGGSNELRFEDKKGSEEVWIRAEKDLNAKVGNDETRIVGNDRTTTVHNDETATVDANKTTIVKGKFDETVLSTETRKVVGNVTETFAANEIRTIAGNTVEMVGGTLTQTVVGGITITTPGAMTIMAQGGYTLVAPGGTRTVDHWFESIGGDRRDLFGKKSKITQFKMDLAFLQIAFAQNKLDTCTLQAQIIATRSQNIGLSFSGVSALEVKTGGIFVMMKTLYNYI